MLFEAWGIGDTAPTSDSFDEVRRRLTAETWGVE
jgi:hypothetical protein